MVKAMQHDEINSFVKSQQRLKELRNFFEMEIRNMIDKEKKKEYYSKKNIENATECYQKCFKKPSESIKFKGEPKMSSKDQEIWEKKNKLLMEGPKYKVNDKIMIKIENIEFPATITQIIRYSNSCDYMVKIDERLNASNVNYLIKQALLSQNISDNKMYYIRDKIVKEDEIIKVKNDKYNQQLENIIKLIGFSKENYRKDLKIGQIKCIPSNLPGLEYWPKCGIVDSFTFDNKVKMQFLERGKKKYELYDADDLIQFHNKAKEQAHYSFKYEMAYKDLVKNTVAPAMGGYRKSKKKYKKRNNPKKSRKKKNEKPKFKIGQKIKVNINGIQYFGIIKNQEFKNEKFTGKYTITVPTNIVGLGIPKKWPVLHRHIKEKNIK